jgi:hypothetical protein
MTGYLHILFRSVCLIGAIAASGCRTGDRLPQPDAGRSGGLILTAAPKSMVIRPGSNGRIKFTLHDELGLPVTDYLVNFSIVYYAIEDGNAEAKLSADRLLTDSNGSVELEVIVGKLPSDDLPTASFSVNASSQGANGVQADITVTTNAYFVNIYPLPDYSLLGTRPVVMTRLWFFDNTTCSKINLSHLNESTFRWRLPLHDVPADGSLTFPGVAAQGSHAVAGVGLDSAGTAMIAGCVDVPGSSLLDSETVRATLFMDHLTLMPLGNFQVSSEFILNPPPKAMAEALATIQSVWQQWSRCKYDPAQLWLDCTIDALSSDLKTDPIDCIPAKTGEGPFGKFLDEHRGTVENALPGTLTTAADTPCRGSLDDSGNPSLEAITDALFSNTRTTLLGANLSTLPTEIGFLLNDVRIDSVLAITQANSPNSYWVEHDLLGISFPNALLPISFKTQLLGLPIVTTSGILASVKADQISVPYHGFTLRLGTVVRYAFETVNLKSRGAKDSNELIKIIFSLAKMNDRNSLLTGCNALDATICDYVKQNRGCLFDACQEGLTALTAKLTNAFNGLDGKDLDFWLTGWAPVIDLDGNGQVDALGTAGGTSAGGANLGLWSAELRLGSSSSIAIGSWASSRLPNSP